MKKFFCVLGICAGIAIIVLGTRVQGLSTGYSYVYDTSFGGDYYSYEYSATRKAALNVETLSQIARTGIAYLLFAIGATDICLFGCKLGEKEKSGEQAQNHSEAGSNPVSPVTESEPANKSHEEQTVNAAAPADEAGKSM